MKEKITEVNRYIKHFYIALLQRTPRLQVTTVMRMRMRMKMMQKHLCQVLCYTLHHAVLCITSTLTTAFAGRIFFPLF